MILMYNQEQKKKIGIKDKLVRYTKMTKATSNLYTKEMQNKNANESHQISKA